MKRIIFILIIFNLAVNLHTGTFDRINIGARALGMGSAFSAVADNPSAIYYNPAGLVLIPADEVEIMRDNLYGLDLINYTFLGYARPYIWRGTLGFAMLFLQLGDEILLRNITEYSFLFSYGIKISEAFSTGINLKFYAANYDGIKASGWTPEIGLIVNFLKNKGRAGLMIQDLISPAIKWETGLEERIEPNLNLGISYNLTKRFLVSSDIKNLLNYERTYSAGCEIEFIRNLLLIRGGISLQKVYVITFGAGINLANFQINIAIKNHSDFGLSWTLGANIKL